MQSQLPSATPAVAAERNTYFITTAIAYPNGIPHIGHAYEAIATDALARFQRLDGKDVFFLTGTDEHGQKMVQTAAERRTCRRRTRRTATPAGSRRWTSGSNVSFDRFIRTTEPAHHHSVQVVWNRMQQNGDIYIDTYAGWYSVRDEAYYAEEETVRRRGQGAPRPAGLAGRMGRGEELFLQAVRLSGPAAEALRKPAGLHRAGFSAATRSSASSRAG